MTSSSLASIGSSHCGQKSNLAVDAMISLATGRPFLGRFAVPKPKRVLALTGETVEASLENLIRRVMAEKHVTEDDIGDNLIIKQQLPNINHENDLSVLSQLIKQYRADVVPCDPRYFMLGPDKDGRPADMNNIAIMGRMLLAANKVCVDAGATLVLIDHTTKAAQMNRAREREPMQLCDLPGSGISQAVAQWGLVNYVEPYDPNTGRCKIWFNVGGRAGHGGLHVVSINEGVRIKGAPWTAAPGR